MRHRILLILSIGIIAGLGSGWLAAQWHENRVSEQSEELFVYGTLQNPLIRFLACRCLTPSEPYTLTGFQVVDLDLRPAPPNSQVSGHILSVTPVELRRFDHYERVPDRYVRVRAPFITNEPWIYLRSETASTTLGL